MAAEEIDAGSSAPVRPGTSTLATRMAGAPASIAAWKGRRSTRRSSSSDGTVAVPPAGSWSARPIPGQCLTTGVSSVSSSAGTTASMNGVTSAACLE